MSPHPTKKPFNWKEVIIRTLLTTPILLILEGVTQWLFNWNPPVPLSFAGVLAILLGFFIANTIGSLLGWL